MRRTRRRACLTSLMFRACSQPGQDATDEFEDIGHSEGAKKQLVEKCALKGVLVGAPEKKKRSSGGGADAGAGGLGMTVCAVVFMAIVAVLVQKFM